LTAYLSGAPVSVIVGEDRRAWDYLLMSYQTTVTTVTVAQPTGREQQIVEIHEVLARLRNARERDAVGDIITSEKRLNYLLERLRPTAN
jgi:hypothetical protein